MGASEPAVRSDSLRQMHAAAQATLENDTSWRVSRDGAPVAVVAVRHEGGDVVVATDLGGNPDSNAMIDPCRFPSLQAAEAFVADLIASFSYLGCDVARA
jgi:hypothetical protein